MRHSVVKALRFGHRWTTALELSVGHSRLTFNLVATALALCSVWPRAVAQLRRMSFLAVLPEPWRRS